jgi:hypothetical protein
VKAVPAEVAIAIVVAAVADAAQAADMVATAEEGTPAAAVVAAEDARFRIQLPVLSCNLSEGRRDAALFISQIRSRRGALPHPGSARIP